MTNFQKTAISHYVLVLLLMTGIIVPPAALSATDSSGKAWPQRQEDLPTDPDIQWGELQNGVRYAARQHADPPDRVSLRLYVSVGSLMEKKNERGLAHFLEHMAFNGTKHFEADEMVKYFQRLGMAFGADTNAFTSFNQTVYQLELPANDRKMLEEGLQLLRDYAGHMTLSEEQIDKERGVILSEMRTRDTVRYRTYKARLELLFPESRISQRLPIGTKQVISAAPRQRFVDFYRQWYAAPHITVVAVGDMPPSEMADVIENFFGDMPQPAELPEQPNLGTVPNDITKVGYHHEKEAGEATLAIQTVAPCRRGPDTRRRRIETIQRYMAHAIISRRLAILSRDQGSPFTSGQAMIYDWLDFATIAGVELKCDPQDWTEALGVAERELRRALEHGFTASEINYQKAQILKYFQQKAETASTRKSRDIAGSIVQAVNADDVYTTPATDLRIAEEALSDLSPAILLETLRNTWKTTDSRYLFAAGNLELDNPRAEIMAAYEASQTQEVAPPARHDSSEFGYKKFGDPGKVQTRSVVKELDITRLKFANNIHVNLKPTKFEADTIQIGIRFGGGQLELPADKPGLALLAKRVFIPGGLEKHSFTGIENIFADKEVDVQFAVDTDAFVLSGTTDREDLAAQLQLMTAYLTAPGYRGEALWKARREIPKTYREMQHTPDGVFQDKVRRFLSSGDPRFGYPPLKDVMKLTLKDVRHWLSEALTDSMLEVSIVGDFEEEKVLEILRQTVGAMPERRDSKRDFSEARKVKFPADTDSKTFEYDTAEPKSMVTVFWPTTDLWDIKKSRRLNVLSRVLADRLRIKIREELGETYSPSAYSYTSDTFENYGYLATRIITDPEKAEKIAGLVRNIGTDIHDKGATEDEVKRALNPLVTMLEEYLRSNEYWRGTVLMGSTEHPERLAWAQSIVEDYNSISQAEVNQIAETYLGPERSLTVLIQPGER